LTEPIRASAHAPPVPRSELPANTFERRCTGNERWRPGGHARRRLLKLLRILLPSFVVILFGLAILFPGVFPDRGRAPIDIAVVDEDAGTDGNTMVNVTYSGVDEEGRPFSLSAKGVRGGPDNERVLLLTEPDARLSLKDGTELTIEAEAGRYDRAADAVDLEGQVTLRHGPDVTVRTSRARVELEAGIASGDQPVEGKASFGAITGKGFRIAERGDSILVDGPAHLVIDPSAKPRLQ
jgi:lipopolysaccharide export system protein LptC